MNFLILFVTNSILLGIGLAMDAFSVSIANALNEPEMKITRMSLIAGCYAFFQFIMPVAGLRSYNRADFYFVSKIYTVDCINSSIIYRRKNAMGIFP